MTATRISDLSNSTAKDGLLKDVYTPKSKHQRINDPKKSPKTIAKKIFGPHRNA
jgi:hypothetical protein